ncbi:hypothetical protein ACE6H2_001724 [Prunus campanulata]
MRLEELKLNLNSFNNCNHKVCEKLNPARSFKRPRSSAYDSDSDSNSVLSIATTTSDEINLSPRRAARVAMLKARFAELSRPFGPCDRCVVVRRCVRIVGWWCVHGSSGGGGADIVGKCHRRRSFDFAFGVCTELHLLNKIAIFSNSYCPYLLAVLVAIVGVGAFLWWARQDMVQDSDVWKRFEYASDTLSCNNSRTLHPHLVIK